MTDNLKIRTWKKFNIEWTRESRRKEIIEPPANRSLQIPSRERWISLQPFTLGRVALGRGRPTDLVRPQRARAKKKRKNERPRAIFSKDACTLHQLTSPSRRDPIGIRIRPKVNWCRGGGTIHTYYHHALGKKTSKRLPVASSKE